MRRLIIRRGVAGGGVAAWMAGLAAVAVAGSGCEKQAAPPKAPPPREVQVLSMTPTEVRDTSEYLGSLLSRQSVNVLPQVAGYIRKIHVKPGQKVAAGDVLVEVDARQVAAAVDSAQAQQNSAGARLELAKQTLSRTEALYKEGLVSAQELERARSDAQAAEAGLRAASAQVSQQQVALQYHAVRAAVPGVIGDVPVRLGDYVGPTTQLTSIAQADTLELSIAVPTQRARQIRPDTPVEILDENGKVLVTSTLFFVAPQADPRTQLVEVKAAFQNNVGLRPSEFVRARIVYSVRKALQVPVLSVVRQSGQPFVFALEEKDGHPIVQRKPITLGDLGESTYVVESGLHEGDRIAISSLQMLRDGAPVKPIGPETASNVSPDAKPTQTVQ